MLVVDDQGGDHPVDGPRWERLAAAVLAAEGVAGPAELTLHFVGEAAMAELHERFMGLAGPTDVLSFPLDEDPGDVPPGQPRLLGDVVVCPAVAGRNAPGHTGSYADELALLVVHGTLHVLGMDHAEPAERRAMQDRERALLADLHGPLAGDPWAAPGWDAEVPAGPGEVGEAVP